MQRARMSPAEITFRAWARLDEVQRTEFDLLRKGFGFTGAKPAAAPRPRKLKVPTAPTLPGVEG